MIVLEVVEGGVQGARHGGDLRQLLGRQVVEVLVHRLARIDLVLDPIQPRHEHRREGEVRVAGGIGEAHLDPLRLRARRVGGNPEGGRPVARAIRQRHRRLVPGNQPLVRVGGGVGDRRQGRAVLDDPADVVEGYLREVGVAVAVEQRLATLPDRLVGVLTGAVVTKQRLRHEGDALAVAPRHVLHDVLVEEHLIRHVQERREAHVDLRLAGGGDLVVLALDGDPTRLELEDHLGAQVLLLVDRGDRDVAGLLADLVAEVRALVRVGIPLGLLRIEEVVRGVLGGLVTDVVEDEELQLRPEMGGVADAGGLQVRLRLASDGARVALVPLPGDRVADVAHQRQGRLLAEGVDHRGGRIGHDQHVGVVDVLPTADGRTVEAKPLLKNRQVDLVHRDGEVLPLADEVAELHVHQLAVIFLR